MRVNIFFVLLMVCSINKCNEGGPYYNLLKVMHGTSNYLKEIFSSSPHMLALCPQGEEDYKNSCVCVFISNRNNILPSYRVNPLINSISISCSDSGSLQFEDKSYVGYLLAFAVGAIAVRAINRLRVNDENRLGANGGIVANR